jgi:hypothetical protein
MNVKFAICNLRTYLGVRTGICDLNFGLETRCGWQMYLHIKSLEKKIENSSISGANQFWLWADMLLYKSKELGYNQQLETGHF